MTKIYESLIDLVGNTPLLRLGGVERVFGLEACLLAKLEGFNPARSVKDRVGFSLIESAEKLGRINAKTVIIEPTSGNTGIGLAFIAARRGYRLILTMPDSMTAERRALLKALGAEIVLTPAYRGMPGAIEKAEELAAEIGNAFIPSQFKNPANPNIHRITTAREIWNDTDGKVDAFVAGVGTGGTITGVGDTLKALNPKVKIIAVEPKDSPVLSGGKPGPHRLQGIGAGFVPEVLDTEVIDEIIQVSTEEAVEAARTAARTAGVLSGISSGAALSAAITLGKRPEWKGKNIVVLLPDTGERYLSTSLYNPKRAE